MSIYEGVTNVELYRNPVDGRFLYRVVTNKRDTWAQEHGGVLPPESMEFQDEQIALVTDAEYALWIASAGCTLKTSIRGAVDLASKTKNPLAAIEGMQRYVKVIQAWYDALPAQVAALERIRANHQIAAQNMDAAENLRATTAKTIADEATKVPGNKSA